MTAYHAYDLDIMAKVAEVLGKTADAAKYREQYEKRKAFFNATFVNAEKKTLATGGGGLGGGPRGAARARRPSSAWPTRRRPTRCGLAHGAVQRRHQAADGRRTSPTPSTRENKDDGGVVRPKYSLMTGLHRHGVDQQGAVADTA